MLYYTLVTIPDERNKTLTITVKIISYLRLDVVKLQNKSQISASKMEICY